MHLRRTGCMSLFPATALREMRLSRRRGYSLKLELGKLADQARLLQLLFGSLSLPKANSIPKYRDANEKARRRLIFLSSAHTCPAHLSVIGGDFVLESVARYAALVRYSEFRGCPLFGSNKCTASTGIVVGISTVVRNSEEVRYWEGPLSEVPL